MAYVIHWKGEKQLKYEKDVSTSFQFGIFALCKTFKDAQDFADIEAEITCPKCKNKLRNIKAKGGK